MTKKEDPASVLMTVISALGPLADEDRLWVLQSAASRWTLTVPPQGTGGMRAGAGFQGKSGAGLPRSEQNAEAQSAISKNDPRAFIRIKKPVYDVQRVACLGYFHIKTTGQQGFSSKDIQKLHTDSGVQKSICRVRSITQRANRSISQTEASARSSSPRWARTWWRLFLTRTLLPQRKRP